MIICSFARGRHRGKSSDAHPARVPMRRLPCDANQWNQVSKAAIFHSLFVEHQCILHIWGSQWGSLSHTQIALYYLQLLQNCQCCALTRAGWCSCRSAANMLWLTDTQCCGGFWQADVCWEISFGSIRREEITTLYFTQRTWTEVWERCMWGNDAPVWTFFQQGHLSFLKHSALCHIYSFFYDIFTNVVWHTVGVFKDCCCYQFSSDNHFTHCKM